MWARVVKFFVSSSLLLSVDGILIVIFGCFLYGIPINTELTIASFLAVFSVYNLNKATDKVEDSVNRPETRPKPTLFYVIPSLVALIVSLLIGALNGGFALIILSTPIIIGLLYSVKVSKKLPRLKEVTGAKSVSVALSWSLIGSFLPLSSQTINLEEVPLVFFYIFVQVMVNTMIFDAFDIKGDSVIKIKTIPTVLGRTMTRMVLLLTNTTLIFWIGFCYFEGFFIKFIPALLLGIVYGYIIIWRFLGKECRSLSSEILIDGEWLLVVPLMRLIIK
jgi:4-hydroxybenzoate polyprenyltransferase